MNKNHAPQHTVLDTDEQWYEDNAEGFVPAGLELRESLIIAASKPQRIATNKKTMVSIRLDPQDVRAIKELANRAGLGYQTLISSLLHQYAVGDLVNIHEAKKVLR